MLFTVNLLTEVTKPPEEILNIFFCLCIMSLSRFFVSFPALNNMWLDVGNATRRHNLDHLSANDQYESSFEFKNSFYSV